MTAQKKQEVLVEEAQVLLYWTCPKCGKDNRENSKRNGGIAELECENDECGTVIVKQGKIRWFTR